MNKPTLASIVFIPTFFVGLLGYWSAFPPSEPIGSANGTYANDCCGSIKLQNGHMFVEKQRVSYVVEHDKIGRYVLPIAYVGVSDANRVSIDRTKSALKLRLDDGPTPMTIELSDRMTTVEFRRRKR